MRSSRNSRIAAHIGLIAVSVLFLIPIVWMLDLALKTESETAVFPTLWLPEVPQWSNFAAAFTHIDFLGYFRNSMIISVITTVLTVLSSSAVAFGLATQRARGKRFVFALIVGTMMLPGIVTTIPIYIMYARVGLTDTYVPWVLMGLGGSAFFIFMIRQGFAAVPREVEEAALIDGCGYFRIWWRIYMPMTTPILAAAVVLQFVWSWGDYLFPRLLLSSENTTLAVAIASGYTDRLGHSFPTLVAAGSLMFALPVIILFLLLQRYFVQGFATSGLK